MNFYRHGDVSLHPIKSIPDGLKKIDVRAEVPYTIRHGETGHRHVITADRPNMIELFQDENGMHYMKVMEPVKLSHEEHEVLTIEPGIYIQKQEVEYNPFTENLNQVVD
jgi:hypothetical protein